MNCDSIVILVICPGLLLALALVLLQLRKQYVTALCQYEEQQVEKHTTLNEKDLEICLPRQRHTISTTPPSITKTTTKNNVDDDKDETECSICLDGFDQGAEYRVLPCRHMFHSSCIDPWLIGYKSSCPMCSQDSTPSMNQEKQVSIKQ